MLSTADCQASCFKIVLWIDVERDYRTVIATYNGDMSRFNKGNAMSQKWILIVIIFTLFLAACGGTSPDSSSQNDEPTEFVIPTATALPTFAPTLTPQLTDGLPSIELLGGSGNTCVNENAFTDVLGFAANQDEMTTANYVTYRLLDSEGNLISEGDTAGENNDGEINWGFYPDAYEVDADSALVVEVQVYESDAEGALLTSSSSLIYNCTTGETISSTIFRAPASD